MPTSLDNYLLDFPFKLALQNPNQFSSATKFILGKSQIGIWTEVKVGRS